MSYSSYQDSIVKYTFGVQWEMDRNFKKRFTKIATQVTHTEVNNYYDQCSYDYSITENVYSI